MYSVFRTRCGLFALAAIALTITGPAMAGSIKGVVKYEGKVPTMRQIKMDADPGCAKKHTEMPRSEMLVLGDDNTMGNVLVRVRSGASGTFTAPKEAVTLNQEGCQYVPHVLGVMVGQDLKILNSDGLLHNVHALPKINQGFNQAMPGSVKEAVKVFKKPEPAFKIKCDVHPWMGAWVGVFTHPFHGVTGSDGTFSLEGLPAGTYDLEALHERLGTLTAQMTVADGGTSTHDFVFVKE